MTDIDFVCVLYLCAQIDNEAHLAKVVTEADAEYYLAQKTAESNKVYSCT